MLFNPVQSILLPLVFFGFVLTGANSGTSMDGIRLPVKAKSPRPKFELEPDTLFATVGGTAYRITTGGKISWGQSFRNTYKLNTKAWVENVYLDTIDNKYLLIFYEENFATDGAASIEKFDMQTKKRVWQVHIPGFNLGQPYIKAVYAYVNVIGMVGKLNLRSGKYVYEFSNLYVRDKSSFNNFTSISFQNNLTYFLSKNHMSKRIDTVIVDEITGKYSIRN